MTPALTSAGQPVSNPSATNAPADSAKPASPNVKYQELFLKLQKEAQENKRGLWEIRFQHRAQDGAVKGYTEDGVELIPKR